MIEKSRKWLTYDEVGRVGNQFERFADAPFVDTYATLQVRRGRLKALLESMLFTFTDDVIEEIAQALTTPEPVEVAQEVKEPPGSSTNDPTAAAVPNAASASTATAASQVAPEVKKSIPGTSSDSSDPTAAAGNAASAAPAAGPSPFIAFTAFVDWYPTIELLQRRQSSAATSSSTPSAIDWAILRKQIPLGLTPEEQQRREKLFDRFDPNGNGFLSLAEVDKGVRDELKIGQIFDCKPVIMRAFQAARNATPATDKNHGGDYVTRSTFRVLLWYMKEYFELWQIFIAADTSGDRRVDKKEFGLVFGRLQKEWGLQGYENKKADDVFAEIDENGGGVVLFDEFAHWALMNNLSVD